MAGSEAGALRYVLRACYAMPGTRYRARVWYLLMPGTKTIACKTARFGREKPGPGSMWSRWWRNGGGGIAWIWSGPGRTTWGCRQVARCVATAWVRGPDESRDFREELIPIPDEVVLRPAICYGY
eukprot:2666951-Rhodomonas_salina.1